MAHEVVEHEAAMRRMNEEYEERVERLKRREKEAAAAQREAAVEELWRRDMGLREAASHEKDVLQVGHAQHVIPHGQRRLGASARQVLSDEIADMSYLSASLLYKSNRTRQVLQ